jgi:hypothetical protein
MALQPHYNMLANMIDECWDKLQKDSISVDELRSFEDALHVFPHIDTSKEQELIKERLQLFSDPVLAAAAEQRSLAYDDAKLLEDACNQPDLSMLPEAEVEGDQSPDEEEF